jgi:transketolase
VSIGSAITLREGNDVALLSTGTLLPHVLETATELGKADISTSVHSVHTVKPLDEELLAHVFHDRKLVVTIEEHSRIGGLGSAVAEWWADHPQARARLLRFGTPDAIHHHSGEQEDARILCGLTTERFVAEIQAAFSLNTEN